MSRSELGNRRERAAPAQAPTLLALETSTAACSVALSVGGTIVEDHRVIARDHNRVVLPMIDALLRGAGIRRRDLDAIAFGRGPGSFTGSRIAAAVTQGISFGLAIPVVGISTLAVLANTAAATHRGARDIVATIRARANEVYVGYYRCDVGSALPLVQDAVATAEQRALLESVDGSWWAVGDGVDHFAEALAVRACHIDSTLLPRARQLVALGLAALAGGEAVGSAAALPVYLQGTRPWRKQSE